MFSKLMELLKLTMFTMHRHPNLSAPRALRMWGDCWGSRLYIRFWVRSDSSDLTRMTSGMIGVFFIPSYD